jgi:hypothetical protein
LLALGVDRAVVLQAARLPFQRLTALGALDGHDPVARAEVLVDYIRVVGQHLLHHALDGIGALADLVPQAQDLVVGGEQRFVKTLVVGVALLDVAEVPLTVERGCVPGIGAVPFCVVIELERLTISSQSIGPAERVSSPTRTAFSSTTMTAPNASTAALRTRIPELVGKTPACASV